MSDRLGYKSSLHYLLLQPNASGFSVIIEQFLLFFSNKDIGKLDITLSETCLRQVFFAGLGHYYTINEIKDRNEIVLLAKRKVPMTRIVCPAIHGNTPTYNCFIAFLL